MDGELRISIKKQSKKKSNTVVTCTFLFDISICATFVRSVFVYGGQFTANSKSRNWTAYSERAENEGKIVISLVVDARRSILVET